MSATTTSTEIAIRLDVLFGGAVVKECCDDDLGVQLPGFAPRCACDLTTIEVRFPVLLSECHEDRTWEYPGYHGFDMEFDRFGHALLRTVDGAERGPISCLLPATARELFDAVSAASESLV